LDGVHSFAIEHPVRNNRGGRAKANKDGVNSADSSLAFKIMKNDRISEAAVSRYIGQLSECFIPSTHIGSKTTAAATFSQGFDNFI